jgi:hypothetical protein
MDSPKKLVLEGCGPIVDKNWKPVRWTARGALRWGKKVAAKRLPKGFWHAVVTDCGDHFRVSFAGQEEK